MPQTLDAPILPPGPITPDLKQSIETAIDAILPPGKVGAVVGVVTTTGVVAGIAVRIGTNWQLGADLETRWGGDVSGRVMVMGSW
jgi:hypothetical protein